MPPGLIRIPGQAAGQFRRQCHAMLDQQRIDALPLLLDALLPAFLQSLLPAFL